MGTLLDQIAFIIEFSMKFNKILNFAKTTVLSDISLIYTFSI